jgi:hypothetical protein
MTTWKRIFWDEFPAAADVDRSRWESPHWTQNNNQAFIGRTGIRNPKDFTGAYRELGLIPCTSQNGADLRFCTNNPLAQPRGSAFLGSELHTIERWGGNGETVKFEARVSCPIMSGGAVASVFSFALCSGGAGQNEIDFEFATNYVGPPPNVPYLTNVFVCSSGGGSGPEVLKTNDPLYQWRTFSLIYTPSQSVEWQIDGYQVRKELRHVPNWKSSGGMGLYMNFWAPKSDWDWAYNENLQPVATPPGDTWHYYVKSAAVYYAT